MIMSDHMSNAMNIFLFIIVVKEGIIEYEKNGWCALAFIFYLKWNYYEKTSNAIVTPL